MAIKGLAAIKKKAQEKAGGFDGESPFVSLKDGENVKVRFLQELDEDSELYDERRGTIQVIEEHAAPNNFKVTAECTAESEGRCYACEQTSNPDNGKKWKSKLRFYANVLVRNPEGDDKVKVLKRGFSDKDIGNKLVNIIEEFENIGGMDCKLTRKGSGLNDTSWDMLTLAPKALTKKEEELELIDLNKFIKRIPYEKQAEYFAGTSEEEKGGSAKDW